MESLLETSRRRKPARLSGHLARHPRRWALSGAALAAAAAAATLTVTQTTTPAYAVERGQDGTITFTVNHIGDPTKANRELQKAGAPIVVMLPTADCQEPTVTMTLHDAFHLNTGIQSTGSDNSIRVLADRIAADQVLVVTPHQSAGNRAPFLQVGLYPKPGPTCIPDLFGHPGPISSASVVPGPVDPPAVTASASTGDLNQPIPSASVTSGH
jgi:hypothetical protein